MAIIYIPLWKELIDKDIIKLDLIKIAELMTNAMANIWNNKYKWFESIEKVCFALDSIANELTAFEKEIDENDK